MPQQFKPSYVILPIKSHLFIILRISSQYHPNIIPIIISQTPNYSPISQVAPDRPAQPAVLYSPNKNRRAI